MWGEGFGFQADDLGFKNKVLGFRIMIQGFDGLWFGGGVEGLGFRV